MYRHDYAEGTYTLRHDGPFAGELAGGKAICADYRLRIVHPTTDGIADTFFSIPAFVYAKGKRVYGFVSINEGAVYPHPPVVCFTAYTYCKHWRLVGPSKLVSDREVAEGGAR